MKAYGDRGFQGHRTGRSSLSEAWQVGKDLSLILLVVIAVLLAETVRQLREEIGVLLERASVMPIGSFSPLAALPDLDGDTIHLGWSKARVRVYFVFNTRCPFCERNIPFWKELSEEFEGVPEVEVFGISLDSLGATASYHREKGVNFRTGVLTDPRLKDSHRFDVVPQTIVVDSAGRVILVRVGVIEGQIAADSVRSKVAEVISGPLSARDGLAGRMKRFGVL